jgi:hypothetical protein
VIISDPKAYDGAGAVSFSWLKRWKEDEDMFYRRFVLGQKPDGEDEEDETKALRIGTAGHCLVLEGPEIFAERYVVQPATYETHNPKTHEKIRKPWNRNAKVCQLWADAQEREIVSASEFLLLTRMRAAVERNPEAMRILAGARCELAIRIASPKLGFDRQGRLDLLNLELGVLGDVKTIERLGDRARDLERRRYYAQLGYYDDLAREEFSAIDFRSCIIWIEKAWPNRCLVEWLKPEFIEMGRAENDADLLELASRFANGDWKLIPHAVEIGPSADLQFRHMDPAQT